MTWRRRRLDIVFSLEAIFSRVGVSIPYLPVKLLKSSPQEAEAAGPRLDQAERQRNKKLRRDGDARNLASSEPWASEPAASEPAGLESKQMASKTLSSKMFAVTPFSRKIKKRKK
jgi:hypothetical protein